MKSYLNKSLEQLENDYWGEPTFDSSLVKECHRLRTIPLRELHAADVGRLIGQDISLQRLVPLALDLLENNPLPEEDRYPGALLIALLRAKSEFWQKHPPYRDRLNTVGKRAVALIDAAPEEYPFADTEQLRSCWEKFQL